MDKSINLFHNWTLVLFNDDSIFAASEDKDVVELDMNLKVVNKFRGRDSRPISIDANEKYLVVGYKSRENYGPVVVHNRTTLETKVVNFPLS